jgi:hypothetical protein
MNTRHGSFGSFGSFGQNDDGNLSAAAALATFDTTPQGTAGPLDAMDTYFECITTCSLEDGECVTRCVEQLRDA